MINKAYIIGGIALLLIILAVVTLSGGSHNAAYSANNASIPIQLTDPPQVPAGTQALIIAYSGEQVHLSNAGDQSGWVEASGSGSIDLMSVINLSQTIGTVSIPVGARIDMARFNVSSAKIKINGTFYNVTVPSEKVTAHINSAAEINGSSALLLDLSPVVATIVTNTSVVYVLVPSVRAVLVPRSSASANLTVGSRATLSSEDMVELEDAAPNVSITGASISSGPGNTTHVSITVKDNSNTSIVLEHAGILGNATVHINGSRIIAGIGNFTNRTMERVNMMCANYTAYIEKFNHTVTNISESGLLHGHANATSPNANTVINSSAGANIHSRTVQANSSGHYYANYSSNGTGFNSVVSSSSESSAGFNATGFGEYFNIEGGVTVAGGFGGERTLSLNNSVCSSQWLSSVRARLIGQEENATAELRKQIGHRVAIVFAIDANGTLQVPRSEEEFGSSDNSSPSLTIGPGQSATLHFDGVMGPHEHGNFFYATVNAGTTYKVGVQGTEGARAVTNVTATSG